METNFLFPLLFEYEPNHFVNISKITTITPSLYDKNEYFCHLEGNSSCSINAEALDRLLAFIKRLGDM